MPKHCHQNLNSLPRDKYSQKMRVPALGSGGRKVRSCGPPQLCNEWQAILGFMKPYPNPPLPDVSLLSGPLFEHSTVVVWIRTASVG